MARKKITKGEKRFLFLFLVISIPLSFMSIGIQGAVEEYIPYMNWLAYLIIGIMWVLVGLYLFKVK